MAQPVDHSVRHGLGVGTGAFEGPLDSRLQRSSPPLPFTWMIEAASSVVRMSPMSA
jgi:hypothetical protein